MFSLSLSEFVNSVFISDIWYWQCQLICWHNTQMFDNVLDFHLNAFWEGSSFMWFNCSTLSRLNWKCIFIVAWHYFQIGDLKGLFGLFMVQMQLLRAKLKILDVSYGTGTGKLVMYVQVFSEYVTFSLRVLIWSCTFKIIRYVSMHLSSDRNKLVFNFVYCVILFQVIQLWYITMANYWLYQKQINLVSPLIILLFCWILSSISIIVVVITIIKLFP